MDIKSIIYIINTKSELNEFLLLKFLSYILVALIYEFIFACLRRLGLPDKAGLILIYGIYYG